ncbi:MAG: dihydroorotase [Bacteroidetes bacterium]|nr:dihydroorotase [Bacteroidota bacterium]
MTKTLIKNVTLVNEGEIKIVDVLISGERIERIEKCITDKKENIKIIDAEGLHLIPGMIDDQVHFREPGLTHKGTIYSESRAAVAGGITSFMDMPNTHPNSTSLEILEEKYRLASKSSMANYSFFMGINKNNLEEALRINNEAICGLSDDGLYFENQDGIMANYPDYLETLFSRTNSLTALHCEDDTIIEKNLTPYKNQYGKNIPVEFHALIRDEEACYLATERVVKIAKKHNARLHVLHVSTAKETTLFDSTFPLNKKRITAEACIHHLWFTDKDYKTLGNYIKWNPSIKSESNKVGLMQALKDNKLDIIATDHAPHTIEEKSGNYFDSKSGGPLVQHALVVLFELYHQNRISLQEIVQKTSHNVAEIYCIKDRGYLREGYYADLVLVDLNKSWTASQQTILYKCGWSPFIDYQFKSKIIGTFVNGAHVYNNGVFKDVIFGKRLMFNKER